jgi:hypothetical protein
MIIVKLKIVEAKGSGILVIHIPAIRYNKVSLLSGLESNI